MKTFNYKPLLISALIIIGFAFMSVFYVSPILDGKELRQHDVLQWQGAAHESMQYEEQTGDSPLWTNSMFSGMPTYLIHITTSNVVRYIYDAFHTTVDHPEMIILMYFVWAFLALLLVGMPMGISALGALFYGLSSYFFIILEAGHITKCIALGQLPLIVASVYVTYCKDKKLLGSAIFAMILALDLIANHLQIVYYTALICIVFVLFVLYDAIKTKEFMKKFLQPSLLLLAGLLLAVGANFSRFYATYDYGKDSIRGKSELTTNDENKTSGLDKDYATAWSYGISETIDLLVPNFKGGASSSELDKDSETFKTLKQYNVPNAGKIVKSMPTYWGEQPVTSGPVYIGALVIFLFVFGLLYVTGPIKWWLAFLTLFSILLAWGHNFMFLTDLFLDYFPGYNKFRTVSMILVIAEFTMPLLAIIAIKKFLEDNQKDIAFKKLTLAFGIVGGFLLLLFITAGLWSFQGAHDADMLPDWLLPSLLADRKAMMTGDIIRSLMIVAAGFGILSLYKFDVIKNSTVIVSLLAGVVILDMLPVNKRYLNNDDFVKATKYLFQPTPADRTILQDTDPNFRVMNFTVSPFNDASTSYFHKSVGGYHGAKMRRYQELIDSCLSKQNMAVYCMLNTKYFILPGENQQPTAQYNQDALGNAWFIKNIHIVPDANAEISALKVFDPRNEAFVDQRYSVSDTIFVVDSAASIQLTSYHPEELHYTTNNSKTGVAIFSEIFYDKGWNAYIDNNLVPHFRANYVLRGLEIPAGNHEITFKFEPKAFYITDKISLIFSCILLISFLAIAGYELKKYYTK